MPDVSCLELSNNLDITTLMGLKNVHSLQFSLLNINFEIVIKQFGCSLMKLLLDDLDTPIDLSLIAVQCPKLIHLHISSYIPNDPISQDVPVVHFANLQNIFIIAKVFNTPILPNILCALLTSPHLQNTVLCNLDIEEGIVQTLKLCNTYTHVFSKLEGIMLYDTFLSTKTMVAWVCLAPKLQVIASDQNFVDLRRVYAVIRPYVLRASLEKQPLDNKYILKLVEIM